MIALISRQSRVARAQPGCWFDLGLTFGESRKNLSAVLAVRRVSFLLENRGKCVFLLFYFCSFTWSRGKKRKGEGEREEKTWRGSTAQQRKMKHEESEGVRGLTSREARMQRTHREPRVDRPHRPTIRTRQRGSYSAWFIGVDARKKGCL